MTLADLTRLFVLAAIWGSSFLFMRVTSPQLGAIPTAFGRVMFGTLGLLAILVVMGVKQHYRGRLKDAVVLGIINSGLPFLMYAVAAGLLPAGYSAVLNATTPLMGVVVGALFFGEPANLSKWVGVVVGLMGVWVLTGAGPVPFDASVLAGAAACLTATACYGLSSFLTRRWITEKGGLDSRLVALGSQYGAVLFLTPFMAWQAASAPPVAMTPLAWWTLAALGLFCTAVAYILYFRLLADIGPVKALSVTFLIPFFGVLWGHVFLDEVLSMAHLLGSGLIALALWLVLRSGKSAKAAAGAATAQKG